MNLHESPAHLRDPLDRSIRRCLHNWASRQMPPADGRDRLLSTAAFMSSWQNSLLHEVQFRPRSVLREPRSVPTIGGVATRMVGFSVYLRPAWALRI